jgi:Cu+-exporting ATPase
MNEHTHHHHHDHCAHGAVPDAVVHDPVCGMVVDPKAGKPSAEHGGRFYHFC